LCLTGTQEDGEQAKLSVFHLFCELFPEVAGFQGEKPFKSFLVFYLPLKMTSLLIEKFGTSDFGWFSIRSGISFMGRNKVDG
jgi:hypothetical protein